MPCGSAKPACALLYTPLAAVRCSRILSEPAQTCTSFSGGMSLPSLPVAFCLGWLGGASARENHVGWHSAAQCVVKLQAVDLRVCRLVKQPCLKR